jgi:plastocyanin
MSGRTIAALALALGGAGVAAGASGASGAAGDPASPPTARAAATKTVKVADNFYSPKRLTVAKGTTIRWKWSNRNADSHDVYLNRKPKGVKRFQSPPAATFFSYKRKLKRAGTYKILCTFHENMTMRIDVER